jgi:hypothetical protein
MFSSRGFGSHEVKSGVEYFTSTRVGGNSQSLSGYVFQADYKLGADGRPEFDANGRLIPRFIPGTSRMQTWLPLRGSSIDVNTASAYVNDRWSAGSRFTFDLGVRYERVRSNATVISKARKEIPGAAARRRVRPDRRRPDDPARDLWALFGQVQRRAVLPELERRQCRSHHRQLHRPAGEGRDFAPGFDPANYQTFTGTFPTANVFFDNHLRSPLTREFTIGVGRELSRSGWARATYVARHATNFIDDFITIADGQTVIARMGSISAHSTTSSIAIPICRSATIRRCSSSPRIASAPDSP